MRSDAWPQYCRGALVRSVSAAAAHFPGPGEEAPKRVHNARRALKEARAIARLFLRCVGEPGRVTIAALASTRRQIGRARDLDLMAVTNFVTFQAGGSRRGMLDTGMLSEIRA